MLFLIMFSHVLFFVMFFIMFFFVKFFVILFFVMFFFVICVLDLISTFYSHLYIVILNSFNFSL